MRARVFPVAPDPREGVPRGAGRRPADQAHVGGEGEPLGGMRAPRVQAPEVAAVREGRRDGRDEALEACGVQRGPFETEPLASRRLHRAIDVEPCEDMVHAPDGLHARGREAPPAAREYAEAAFALADYADGTGVQGRDRPLARFMTGGLEGGDGLRRFGWGSGPALCAWRGNASARCCRGCCL
jgi:hypothetical protein